MEDSAANPARNSILSFLQCKDDTLTMLTLDLYLTVLEARDVSPELLEFCCLNTTPKSFDFSTVIDIETLLKHCLGVMCTDPPAYRICTYKHCAEVISGFWRIFKDMEPSKVPQEIIALAKKALK